MRLWVEIPAGVIIDGFTWSASLWGCELKLKTGSRKIGKLQSASLWGCELKFRDNFSIHSVLVVSLLVRLWVEITSPDRLYRAYVSASLWGCELKWSHIHLLSNYTPSASLWGCELKYRAFRPLPFLTGQPPCEAVSWNASVSPSAPVIKPSASLWGCELKCTETVIGCIWRLVSLLVRLWVEMFSLNLEYSHFPSASLWGCELKLLEWLRQFKSDKSASLWGCELKCLPRPY